MGRPWRELNEENGRLFLPASCWDILTNIQDTMFVKLYTAVVPTRVA